jgi:hypothetical protein
MDLVSRVQGILLKPKEEWIKIKEEKLPISQLFTSYAMILAAIPAVAQFIGLGLIGQWRSYSGWFRFGIGTALLNSIFLYVLSLVSVYALGIIISALAPTFSSKQNQDNAMKLAVFSWTAAWVGGIFYLIPPLGILALLASFYGLYILYLGFATPLMDTPKDKVVGYLVVSIIIAIVLMVIASAILGAIITFGAVGRVY